MIKWQRGNLLLFCTHRKRIFIRPQRSYIARNKTRAWTVVRGNNIDKTNTKCPINRPKYGCVGLLWLIDGIHNIVLYLCLVYSSVFKYLMNSACTYKDNLFFNFWIQKKTNYLACQYIQDSKQIIPSNRIAISASLMNYCHNSRYYAHKKPPNDIHSVEAF